MRLLTICNLAALVLGVWAVPEKATAQNVTANTEIYSDMVLTPRQYVWADTGVGEVSARVNLATQMIYVMRDGEVVAASSVSSGEPGRDTPLGSYPILQKAAKHRSNLYGASMPFMQRLTWDGIALHSGNNPGFPASHGCVRLPRGFAELFFAITKRGDIVDVVYE
jgi:lipoprotein-anchoring transpeptidase ErfK/SrfK